MRSKPTRIGFRSSVSAACFALILPMTLSIVLLAAVSAADPDAPPNGASKPPEPISLGELPREIERTQTLLRDADQANTISAGLSEIRDALPAITEKIRKRSRTTEDLLDGHPPVEALEDIENVWLTFDRTVQAWNVLLTGRVLSRGEALSRVRNLASRWQRIAKVAREENAPRSTLDRIRRVREEIRKTQKRIEEARDHALTLQGKVADVGQKISSTLLAIQDTRRERVGKLLTRDSSVLFGPGVWEQEFKELPTTLRATMAGDFVVSVKYLRSEFQQVVFEMLGLLVLIWFFVHARRRAAKWSREDPQEQAIAQLLERPISAALLLVVMLLPWLHPTAPSLLAASIQGLALFPALRILLPLFGPGLRPALLVLAGFYLVDQLRHAAVSVPLVPHILFVTEMGAGAVFMFLLLRPARLLALPPRVGREVRFRWTGRGLHALRAAFSFAFVVALSGYMELGVLVGSGALRSAYLAAVLYAAVLTVQGLVAFLLRIPVLRHLRIVQCHHALLERRCNAALRVAAVVGWIIATLDFLSLRDVLLGEVLATLKAPIQLGSLAFSLADLLLFVAIIWLAVLASRALRFVLEEEVYQRLSLTRGVPYAISTLTHYGILLAGFLLAVFSLGVNLDRFALIAGALGVGVGFGLQNVVNNFVSGLILLFERPVQVGDSIQIGELLGDVRRIGIRSSTLRTWEGAEVIVPNASLISDQVINWTLSDRLRRIDVPVGVAYGNDPERVIEILLEVARTHPQILAQPTPEVLFTGFGDSSLDFQIRAWTGHFKRWITISSEIAVATSHALRDAGIEIPFPQRDLHLRSLDPAVEQALKKD